MTLFWTLLRAFALIGAGILAWAVCAVGSCLEDDFYNDMGVYK